MINSEFGNQWPAPNDRLVVDEMLSNPDSSHWTHCRNFIERLIRASNLPMELKEDAVQNAMLAVIRSLRDFRGECKLRSWLGIIVRTRVLDVHRNRVRDNRWMTSDPFENPENGVDDLDLEISASLPTPEEICLIREELAEVLAALQIYISTHQHSERNSFILQKVLLEGRTCEEVAQQLNISSAVVGYTVRTARRELREKTRH